MSDDEYRFEKQNSDASDNENDSASDNESGSDDSGSSDSEQVQSVISDSDNEIPETLQNIFDKKHDSKKQISDSIFSKNRGANISSSNVEDEKMKKANAMFESMNVFNKVALNAKQIRPMFSEKLDKKQRKDDREKDTGKAWGKMDKVEMTDELRNDLKAIKFRNQIFPKRFYKNNDSENLPKFFQIGTVVDANGVGNVKDRLTKKQQKRTIA